MAIAAFRGNLQYLIDHSLCGKGNHFLRADHECMVVWSDGGVVLEFGLQAHQIMVHRFRQLVLIQEKHRSVFAHMGEGCANNRRLHVIRSVKGQAMAWVGNPPAEFQDLSLNLAKAMAFSSGVLPLIRFTFPYCFSFFSTEAETADSGPRM